MQMKNVPSKDIIDLATRKSLFFDAKQDNAPILVPTNHKKKIRKPATRTLAQIINCYDDDLFLDFLEQCLDWSPIKRITPLEALQHEWILQGLPEKVLVHHNDMFKGTDRSRDKIWDATHTEIQGFPVDATSKPIAEIVR
jgi:dual specificity tyrosine-phosphorylation-regulated kinase 2/3/4